MFECSRHSTLKESKITKQSFNIIFTFISKIIKIREVLMFQKNDVNKIISTALYFFFESQVHLALRVFFSNTLLRIKQKF